MRRIRFERNALIDLQRIHRFLASKNPRAADRAVKTVRDAALRLSTFPEMGRLASEASATRRELLVPFSRGGYAVLYELQPNEVVVLAIRHQLEAGY